MNSVRGDAASNLRSVARGVHTSAAHRAAGQHRLHVLNPGWTCSAVTTTGTRNYLPHARVSLYFVSEASPRNTRFTASQMEWWKSQPASDLFLPPPSSARAASPCSCDQFQSCMHVRPALERSNLRPISRVFRPCWLMLTARTNPCHTTPMKYY